MRGQPRELVTVREADQYEGHNVPALTVKNGVTSPGGEQPGFLIQIPQNQRTNVVSIIVECPRCHNTREIQSSRVSLRSLPIELESLYSNGKAIDLCQVCRRYYKRSMGHYRSVNGENYLKINGCRLKPGRIGNRCDPFDSCENYENCLEEVAKRDWPGWTASGPGGVKWH